MHFLTSLFSYSVSLGPPTAQTELEARSQGNLLKQSLQLSLPQHRVEKDRESASGGTDGKQSNFQFHDKEPKEEKER